MDRTCQRTKRSVTEIYMIIHHLGTRLGSVYTNGVICNRIVFDAATPSVYTTPIETVGDLRTGQYKMQTADCRLGLKCGLGTKCRLQTGFKMQTEA